MYHRRLEFNVTAGRLAAFEEGQAMVGELRKKQKGFIGQAVLQSYGYPGKHAVTIRWETWDAADAFARSKAFRDLMEETRRTHDGTQISPSTSVLLPHHRAVRPDGYEVPSSNQRRDETAGSGMRFEESRRRVRRIQYDPRVRLRSG